MLKKLKIKFIATITTIISVLIFFILLSVNLILNKNTENRTFDDLRQIATADGYLNREMQDFRTSNLYFSIKLDHLNNIKEIVFPNDFEYNAESVEEVLNYSLSFPISYGHVNNLAFLKMQKPYGKIVVFLDIANSNEVKKNLIYISIIVFVTSFALILLISYFLTKWFVKPVKETFEMQKHFIENASHELKTPLAIISTNISILKDEDNLNSQKKWINNAIEEVFKMNELVNKLLTLAKAEIIKNKEEKEEINLSEFILNCVLTYESVALKNNKILKYNIGENIFLKVFKNDIETIVRIFIDNALKYSSQNDIIEVSLKNDNNKIKLSIFNTGIGIKDTEIKNIFDRFYRVDASRNKEIEGYGLGLSIAKKIIDNNKWKVVTKSIYTKWVKFTIYLKH